MGRQIAPQDIHCCGSHGPTFGAGHDIHVADFANSNTFSSTSPGHSYQLPAGQSAQTFFTGARNFQATEVEVYQVQVQQPAAAGVFDNDAGKAPSTAPTFGAAPAAVLVGFPSVQAAAEAGAELLLPLVALEETVVVALEAQAVGGVMRAGAGAGNPQGCRNARLSKLGDRTRSRKSELRGPCNFGQNK